MPTPLPPAPAIIVSGEPITLQTGDEAFGALQLRADDLRMASGRVEDALRAIGDLQLFRASSTRTSNPTAEGLTARGFAGNAASRMEVTVNGVPLADPFFGFISWGALIGQPFRAGDLIRGGGLGGPGALAGTLALETATDATSLQLRGGSRNSFDGSGVLSVPVAGGHVGLSGGYARGDGFYLVRHPGAADVPSRYRQWSAAGFAETRIGDLHVDARIDGFADQRLRGVDGADIETSGGDASLRARHEGAWTTDLTIWGKLRDFSAITRPVNATRDAANTVLDEVKTPASSYGVELGAAPPLGDDAALRLGAAWRASTGQTEERFSYVDGLPTKGRVAGGSQQVASVFANGTRRLSPALLLTAAGRLDRWRLGAGELREFLLGTGVPTLGDFSAPRTGWEASGRLGAVWQLTPAISLRAAGYRGWRLPTLNELYRPFRAGANATIANPDLRPEHLWGAEASLSWQPADFARFSATYFRNRLQDSIANVTLGTGPGNFAGAGFIPAGGRYIQRQNLGAIRSQGIESDARLALGPWALRLSGAWVEARVEGGVQDGLRPAQAPQFSGSATFGWEQPVGGAHLTVRYLGPRFEDDRNVQKLAGATTLDADVAIALAHGVALQLQAENLTNANIETAISGNQFERGQPRTLWLGLRWTPTP